MLFDLKELIKKEKAQGQKLAARHAKEVFILHLSLAFFHLPSCHPSNLLVHFPHGVNMKEKTVPALHCPPLICDNL